MPILGGFCFTMSMWMWNTGNKGFTLLEVMVSMAILATAFAAVIKLYSGSMELIISSRAQTKGAELAQFKMTEIEYTGIENVSLMSGDFDDYAPEYTWNIRIEPAPVDLWLKVTVTVSNRYMGKGGEFQLTEYYGVRTAQRK